MLAFFFLNFNNLQEAREMQKRRDEIEEIRALKYLNKKENVMDCPPAIDRLWNLKLPGMPLAAVSENYFFILLETLDIAIEF